MRKFYILINWGFIVFFVSGNILYAQGKKPDVIERKTEQKKESVSSEQQKQQQNQTSFLSTSTNPQSPQFSLRKISLEETKKIFDDGKAIFIDGRSFSTYSIRHIKGALSLPLGEFDAKIAEIKQKAPIDMQIIVYCSGESCGLAEKVGRKMTDHGYANILIFSGGWPAWAQANYPAEP